MKKTIISYDRKIVQGKGQQVGYDQIEMKTIVKVTNCTPDEHKQAREELKTIRPTSGNIVYSFHFTHVDADGFEAEINREVINELEALGYSF